MNQSDVMNARSGALRSLRAFLQYNAAFRVEFFLSYLWHIHREALASAMPLLAANGSSLWLRKA